MKPNGQDRIKMNRALRDILLEAPEEELRQALANAQEDFDALAARAKTALRKALAGRDDAADVRNLYAHRLSST